jgi:hypothetical protein
MERWSHSVPLSIHCQSFAATLEWEETKNGSMRRPDAHCQNARKTRPMRNCRAGRGACGALPGGSPTLVDDAS